MGKDIIRVGNIGVYEELLMQKRDPNNDALFIPVDLTPVSPGGNVKMEFMRPNGTKLIKDAVITGAPTLGKIRYIDTDGSVYNTALAKRGSWQKRGVITFNDNTKFIGSWFKYQVGE